LANHCHLLEMLTIQLAAKALSRCLNLIDQENNPAMLSTFTSTVSQQIHCLGQEAISSTTTVVVSELRERERDVYITNGHH
jgi:hypothetical protein